MEEERLCKQGDFISKNIVSGGSRGVIVQNLALVRCMNQN